jgi:hypothetical protein
MLLAREVVSYISKQLVKSLTPGTIETSNPDLVADKIADVISEELAVEDRLNDEVRDLLSQYSVHAARGRQLPGDVPADQKHADFPT